MIEIKTANTDDEIRAITDTAAVIWHEWFTPLIGEAQVEYMLDKFQSYRAVKKAVDEDGYCYYYGTDKEKCVCYCGIHNEGGGRVFLSKLYVMKEYRRRGYAGMMLKHMLNQNPDCREVYLTVNKHNDIAIAVYKAMGFELTDSVVTDIGGGFVMDDYIFTLRIK